MDKKIGIQKSQQIIKKNKLRYSLFRSNGDLKANGTIRKK